ncbi:hypothetical protein NO995_15310 [Aestuariibaculum sp. M13]|uniref:hypothetical protein n=1 Tax=Aestuariibaculum sp. M13 TaxID=2967132 RepID=UPI002159DB19|nr:hypothetical protein [Aestuariibaculum sp. M13]MCR8669054.1 hypothetical protein [Aestuariibaculum sp. M13]
MNILKNGIDTPNTLGTHHFGIFSSRISRNFKAHVPENIGISFNSSSGNVFHPFVEAYFPKNPEVRLEQSQVKWHDRAFFFLDQETTPAHYMNILVDAVIKEFRFEIDIPIAKQHELDISLRSHLITKGKYPLSIFTSDEFIEWTHSTIIAKEDPYGRRYYGLNQANIAYLDRNGNTLELHNNDFIFSGIEFNHYFYPNFNFNRTKDIFINFGSHLGWNTSKYNHSLDIGISANGLKTFNLKNNYQLNLGLAFNLLRKNIINFNNSIDLGNNPFLGTGEADIELTKFTKNNHYHALGVNYQLQSRYNKKEEASYYQLIGKWQEIRGGWHHGISTLYKTLTYWAFTYTYGWNTGKLSVYLKEDFLVNNAADLQSGINFSFPIFHKKHL